MAKRFPTFSRDKEQNDGYEYFVNEEKGIVVAKLSHIREKFADAILNVYNVDRWSYEDKDILMATYLDYCIATFFGKRYKELHDSLTARATCSPEDEFDAEVGMNIAKRKLEIRVLEMWIDLCIEIENTSFDLNAENKEKTDCVIESLRYRAEKFSEMLETLN